ncbi:MAG: DUF1851 domain-containing protein [Rhodobacteraceae bacterium]|nr:DUF1851 domain-containing protein [Paracoccaceae bacterium]
MTVDLAEGTISSEWLASTEFVAGFVPPPPPGEPDPNVIACGAIRYDEEDWDYFDFMGDEMLKRCIKAHGALELGQCYGFVPALALAGPESPMRNVDNIQRVSALEHFALLAQLQPFRLIQLTANGIETVREIG